MPFPGDVVDISESSRGRQVTVYASRDFPRGYLTPPSEVFDRAKGICDYYGRPGETLTRMDFNGRQVMFTFERS